MLPHAIQQRRAGVHCQGQQGGVSKARAASALDEDAFSASPCINLSFAQPPQAAKSSSPEAALGFEVRSVTSASAASFCANSLRRAPGA